MTLLYNLLPYNGGINLWPLDFDEQTRGWHDIYAIILWIAGKSKVTQEQLKVELFAPEMEPLVSCKSFSSSPSSYKPSGVGRCMEGTEKVRVRWNQTCHNYDVELLIMFHKVK